MRGQVISMYRVIRFSEQGISFIRWPNHIRPGHKIGHHHNAYGILSVFDVISSPLYVHSMQTVTYKLMYQSIP